MKNQTYDRMEPAENDTVAFSKLKWVEPNVEYEVHTSASGVSAVSRCVEALMSSSVRSSSDGPTMASRVSDTLEGRLDDCCIM